MTNRNADANAADANAADAADPLGDGAEALQEENELVDLTGDGVGDALIPADELPPDTGGIDFPSTLMPSRVNPDTRQPEQGQQVPGNQPGDELDPPIDTGGVSRRVLEGRS